MADYPSMPDIITGTPNEVLASPNVERKFLTEM